MLEENKKMYEDVADIVIPDWRDMDVNEIIRLASDCKVPYLKDGYIGAAMSKYWNKLNKFYSMCKLVATPEDVHGWLTTALMYAIDNKPWENPESSIYNDPKGPDKVVNRVVASRRVTFYQQLNRYNRKINSAIYSLDGLSDDYKDVFTPAIMDNYEVEIHESVIQYFNEQDFMMAFIIDAILYENVMTDKLELKRIGSHLRHLDQLFAERFADMYQLELPKVKYAISIINGMSSRKLKQKIEYNVARLRLHMKEDF